VSSLPDDHEEKYHLNYDEACQVIEWAAATAALVVLMHNDPMTDPLEKLKGYEEAIANIYAEIPESIEDAAFEIAQESLEEAAEDEKAVEAFRAELEGL
jgi:hypothetical protein